MMLHLLVSHYDLADALDRLVEEGWVVLEELEAVSLGSLALNVLFLLIEA